MSAIGGFEREVDIEERRRKRQEEWEKVRTEDQPEGKNLCNLNIRLIIVTDQTPQKNILQ